MDKIIKLSLELDNSNFKESITQAKEDAQTLKETVDSVSSLKMNDPTGAMAPDGSLQQVPILNNVETYTTILKNANTALTQYETNVKRVSSSLQSLFSQQINQLTTQVNVMNSSIDKNVVKRKNFDNFDAATFNNKTAVQAAAISTTTHYLNQMFQGSNNAIFKNKNVKEQNISHMSTLAEQILSESAREARTGMSLGLASNTVANDRRFGRYLQELTGNVYDTNTQAQAARVLLSMNPRARRHLTESGQSMSSMQFIKTPSYFNNVEALPESMRTIYGTAGIREGKKSSGETAIANNDVYRRLIALSNYGENSQLIDFAQKTGLMKLNNGHKMVWRSQATMDQMDTIAGLAAAELYKTRLGSPLYPRDPLDNPSTSKRVRELNDIINVLAKQEGLNAGILKEEEIAKTGSWLRRNKDTSVKAADDISNTLRTFRSPDMYIVPQTRMDKNGRLVFSDPSTAKRNSQRAKKGFGDLDDDNFVAINESAFTYLLGYTNADNNTFGTGVDKSGYATYKNPKILKLNTSKLVPKDEWGYDLPGTDGHATLEEKQLAEYIQKGFVYKNPSDETDNANYRFGWVSSGGKGAYFVQNSAYEDVVRRASEKGLANPFVSFNEGGFIVEGDREKTTKQINNIRKGATPSVRLEEYGFNTGRIGTIDYQLLDALYGKNIRKVSDAEKIDGLAILSPEAVPSSIQGRLFAGAAKFMGQKMSIADLIAQSGAIDVDKIKSPGWKNQLITVNQNNKHGFSYWMPSMALRNLGEEDALAIMQGLMEGTEPAYTGLNAERLRNEYFTDVMSDYSILLTDSAIKNVDQFRVMSEANYRKMFHIDPSIAIDSSKYDSKRPGMVKLSKAEHERYMKEAADFTGGLWAAKTNDDFLVQKDTMALTVQDSIDLPPSVIARSNQIYKAMENAYSNEAWLYEHFSSNPRFADKIRENPNWIKSQEAKSIVEEEITALRHERDNEHKVRLDADNYNALAQIMPGTTVERSFELNKLAVDRNSIVAPLFPSLIQEYFSPEQKKLAIDRGILKGGKLDASRIMYAPGYSMGEAIGGRMPAAPGTYADLLNLAVNQKDNKFYKAFAAISSNDVNQITLPTQAIQRMNTGDFDGDTIWLYAVASEQMYENLQNINKSIDGARVARQKLLDAMPERAKKLYEVKNERDFGKEAIINDEGQAVVGAIRGAQKAQPILGAASAGIRNLVAYGDMNDKDTAHALLSLVEYYDKATSEVLNKGENAELNNTLAQQFMMSGRTFNRLMKQIGEEETTGEKRVDNIFKYRTAEPTSVRDFAIAGLQAVARHNAGTDSGLRRSLLSYVDRRHTAGTAAHSAAEWYANYIADTESGFHYWSKDEFEKEAAKHMVALRGAGDDESINMANYLQKRANEVREGKTLSSDVLQGLRDANNPIFGDTAKKMLDSQATQQERVLLEEQMRSFNEQRKFAQELKKEQERAAILSDVDASKLGLIQDTGDLKNFITSFSVTSVEPWMNGEDARSKLLKHIQSGTVVNLAVDPYSKKNNYRLELPEHFGNEDDIAKRQAEELTRTNLNNKDTVLGTFMHSGLEEYFKENAKAIAEGTFAYSAGDLTKAYRDSLDKITKDQEGNAISWENYFGLAGIDINDIKSAFTQGGSFGTTVRSNAFYARKLRNLFGVDTGYNQDEWLDENKNGKAIGAPDLMLMSMLTYGDYETKPVDTSKIPDYVPSNYGPKVSKLKRVVMTENNIFDEKGEYKNIEYIADSYPLDIPELGGTRFIHAKPDLIYEDENGVYNILDHKSSDSGAVSALYQNMIYVKILERLSKAANTGYWEDGTKVESQDMLEPYKQFMKVERDAAGNIVNMTSRFKGGKIQAFNLLDPQITSIDYSEGAITDVFDEYYKATRKKAKDLREGYISGKRYLQETGMFQVLDPTIEREMQEAKVNADKFAGDENKTRRDFLVAQFAEDKNKIPEIKSQIYKFSRKYGLVGESATINQFSWITDALNGALSKDMMSALYEEYKGAPEIQKVIADMMSGKKEAEQGLRNVITAAALQDPENALKSITKIARGDGQSSTALSAMDRIDKIVKTAMGSREALKTEDVWDGTSWRTKARIVEEVGTDEQIKKLQAANQKERERAVNARIAEANYNDAQGPIDRLLARRKELIPELTENEIEKDRNELKNLIGEKDPYAKLATNIKDRETQVRDWISAKQAKIEEINEKLEKTTNGVYDVTGKDRELLQNEVYELNNIINGAEQYLKGGNIPAEILRQRKESLGLITKTPAEKAAEWLSERKAALTYEAKQDLINARSALVNAESDPASTLQEREALERDYRQKEEAYNSLLGTMDPLSQQAKHLEQMWTEQEQRPLEDFQRSLNRTAISRNDYIKNTVADMQARAIQMATNQNLSEDVRNQWMAIVNNKDLWDKQGQLAGEDFNRRENMAQFQHDQRMSDIQFQREQNERARAQSYMQHNRGRFGQSTSRFVNAYRANRDYWFSLNQSYEQNTHAAQREQANITRLENEIAGMGATQQERERHQDYNARNRELEEAKERLIDYQNAAAGAQEQMGKFSRPASIMNSAFQSINSTVNTLIMRFGRQLFSSALRETTNFVKQFDASMNQIQMITLKSDSEISKLGDSLIDKAKELKVSVSEISQSAATLYRQGLSDAEVDERLEVVSKFSKVSGTKVDAATKLITVAMNTGLVKQAEEASDIVTALGDNAATNAAEIEKGIEKAGAAAAADGTTFAQLASMLTAITSTTQIGGNVAGRTLNTIFGRMNKIGTNELIYDENGNAISGSAVAKLLESEGIKMYDENGNKRSTYDTLYALSQKWDSLSDAKQQQFANAIAGTRQYSNFAAIMTGMSEGKVDEYMQLAGESSGITDKKYEIYTKSLNASLTDLRNTWDGLVHDMTDSGALGGFVGVITNAIQGIDNLTEHIGGVGAALAGIVPTAMLLMGLRSGSLLGAAVAGVGALAVWGISEFGKNTRDVTKERDNAYAEIDKTFNTRSENLNKIKELNSKGNNRTSEENTQLEALLRNVSVSLNLSEEDTKKLLSSKDEKQINELVKQSETKNINDRIKSFSLRAATINAAAEKEIKDAQKAYEDSSGSYDTQNLRTIFGVDTEEEFNGDYFSNAALGARGPGLFGNVQGTTKVAIADLLKNAREAGRFNNEKEFGEYANYTDADWDWFANYLFNTGGNGIDPAIMDKIATTLKQYWLDTGANGQGKDNIIQSLIERYKADISEIDSTFTDEELTALATKAANDYYTGRNNGKTYFSAIREIFKMDDLSLSPAEREEAKKMALIDAGIINPRQQKLQKLELEDAGETGYYIDLNKRPGENGYYLTQDEAISRIETYNKREDFETARYNVYDLDTANKIISYNAKDVGTKKDALAAAKAEKRWLVRHPDGSVEYVDENGNEFKNSRDAKRYSAQWDRENGTWTVDVSSVSPDIGGSLSQYNVDTTKITRTSKKAAQDAATEEYNKLLATRYGLMLDSSVSKPFDISYGTKKEAYHALNVFNETERQNAERRAVAAQMEQDALRYASFYDYTTGQLHEAKGKYQVAGLRNTQKLAVEELMKKHGVNDVSELFRYVDENGNEAIGTLDELNAQFAQSSYHQTRIASLKSVINNISDKIEEQEKAYIDAESQLSETYQFTTPAGKTVSRTVSGNNPEAVLSKGEQQINKVRDVFLRQNPYALFYSQDWGMNKAGDFYGYTTNPDEYLNSVLIPTGNGGYRKQSQSAADEIMNKVISSGLWGIYKEGEEAPIQYFTDKFEVGEAYRALLDARDDSDYAKTRILQAAGTSTNDYGLTTMLGRVTDANNTVLVDEKGITKAGKDFLIKKPYVLSEFADAGIGKNPYSWKQIESVDGDATRNSLMQYLGMSYLFNEVASSTKTTNATSLKTLDGQLSQMDEITARIDELTGKRRTVGKNLALEEDAYINALKIQEEYQSIGIDENGRLYAYGGNLGGGEQTLIEAVSENEPTQIAYAGPEHARLWDRNPHIGKAQLKESSVAEQMRLGVEETNENYVEDLVKPQIKAIKDYFLSNATSSYTSWLTDSKNAYASTADNMIRLIQSNGILNNSNPVQALLRYINNNEIQEWDSLYTNAEFGRMMSQIKRDKYGTITSMPSDMMSQIMTFLLSQSRDYASISATDMEKASAARKAFFGLQGVDESGGELNIGKWKKQRDEYIQILNKRKDLDNHQRDVLLGIYDKSHTDKDNRWYVSQEARNNDIQAIYDKEIKEPWQQKEDEFNKWLKEEDGKNGRKLTTQEKEYITKQHAQSNPLKSIDEYGDENFGTGYLTSLDDSYLQGILGTELTSRVKLARENNESLTAERTELAYQLLDNAQYGIKGLTDRNKYLKQREYFEKTPSELSELWSSQADVVNMYMEGFSGAQQLRELLPLAATGQLGDRQNEYDTLMAQWGNQLDEQQRKYDFAWSSERNGSKLYQNYETLLEGTETEKASMFNNWYTQSQEAANAQYLISSGSNTAENRKMLTSLLSMTDQQVNDLMKDTGGRKKLSDRLNNRASDILDEFVKSLGLDKNSFETLTKQDILNEAAEKGVGDMANMILSMFGDIDYDAIAKRFSGEINAQAEKTAGQSYEEQVQELKTQGYQTRAATWFNSNIQEILDSSKEIVGDSGGRYYSKGLGAAIDEVAKRTRLPNEVLDSIVKNQEFVGMANGFDKGVVSSETIQTYLANLASGGKADASFYTSLRKDLLGSFVDETGNIKTDNLEGLQKRLQDLQSGQYAGVFQILSAKYEDLLKIITATDTSGLDRLIESLNNAFGEDAVKELTEFSNVSKTVQEGLTNIMNGNAILGIAQIRQENLSTARDLVKANKLKNGKGEFRDGSKYNYSQLKQLAAAYGGKPEDYKLMSAAGIKAAEGEALSTGGLRDIGTNVVETWKSLNEKFGAITGLSFDKDGKIAYEAALEGITNDEAKEAFREFFRGLNEDIEKDFMSYNWAQIMQDAGYAVLENADKVRKTYEGNSEFSKLLQDMKLLGDGGANTISFDENFLINTPDSQLNDKQREAKKRINAAKIEDRQGGASVMSDEGETVTVNGRAATALPDDVALEKYRTRVAETVLGKGATWDKLVESNPQMADTANLGYAIFGDQFNKGGGGGGGQPAWAKLLQEMEQKIKEFDHRVKLAQLKQEYYGYQNNYSKQLKYIRSETRAYKELEKQLKKNIKELKEEREKVDKNSQEYKKLTEAIQNYEVKLQETMNARQKMIQKRMAIVEEKQDWRDTQEGHVRTINDTHLTRAQKLYQSGIDVTQEQAFGQYTAGIQTSMGDIRTQINTNNSQIEQWKKLLKKAKKDSDDYREIQKKIWAIEEENAQLQNDLLDKEIELVEANLAQITVALNNKLAAYGHASNMAEVKANLAQFSQDYAGYRGAVREQQMGLYDQRYYYNQAIASTKVEMAGYTVGSAAWYKAQEQLFSLEEAAAKLDVTFMQLNKTISESYLNEILTKIDKSYTNDSLLLSLAEGRTQRAQINGDYDLLPDLLQDEQDAMIKQRETKIAAFNELLATVLPEGETDIGKITDLSVGDEVAKQIKSTIQEIDQLTTAIDQKSIDIQKARLAVIDERYERQTDWTNHRLDMLGYIQTSYKNKGELTNYGAAVEEENMKLNTKLLLAQAALAEATNEYNSYQDKTSVGALAAAESVQKYEKEVAELTNKIEENTEAHKENEQAIRQARSTVEDASDSWIRAAIQKEKDMNSETVSLQNTLLDVIRKRYEAEWELIQKDLSKKKEALNDEKALINERLAARRNAMNQNNEELKIAELQKQLALIEADPTRSKEAKALRAQIAELQQDRAQTEAENIGQARIEELEAQEKAYADYEARYQEEMEEKLKDNNNFREYLSNFLSDSNNFEDLYQEVINSEDYKGKTDEEKRKIRYELQDTWNKSFGILETYWDKMNDFLITGEEYNAMSKEERETKIPEMRELFLEQMRGSDEYLGASETKQKMMEYSYGKEYDEYIASLIDTHRGVNYNDEMDREKATQDFLTQLLGDTSTLTIDNFGAKMTEALTSFGEDLKKNILPEVLSSITSGIPTITGNQASIAGISSEIKNITDNISTFDSRIDTNVQKWFDMQKADQVSEKIKELIENIDWTQESADNIAKAKSAYRDLTDEQKGRITARAKELLDTADARYSQAVTAKQEQDKAEAKAHRRTLLLQSGYTEADIDKYGLDNPDVDLDAVSAKILQEHPPEKVKTTPTSKTGEDAAPEQIDLSTSALEQMAQDQGSSYAQISSKNAVSKEVKEAINQLALLAKGVKNKEKTGYGDHEINDYRDAAQAGTEMKKNIRHLFAAYVLGWEAKGKKVKNLADTKKFEDIWSYIKNGDTYNRIKKEGFDKFHEGGYVDYTGLAWVDGTPSKPESFLDYVDTQNIRDLADSLRYVAPLIPKIGFSDYMVAGNHSTIGDINITINQAELKQDADYDEVARKIGKAFTKQLQQEGFNLANYAF